MTPLSELQIKALHKYVTDTMADKWRTYENPKPFMVEFARAVEQAHGIEKTK